MRGFFVGKIFPLGCIRVADVSTEWINPDDNLTEIQTFVYQLITLLIDKKHDFNHFLSIRSLYL
jgi:hypothetical protein